MTNASPPNLEPQSFPAPREERPPPPTPTNPQNLTLEQYYTGQALVGILARPERHDPALVSEAAYLFGDAAARFLRRAAPPVTPRVDLYTAGVEDCHQLVLTALATVWGRPYGDRKELTYRQETLTKVARQLGLENRLPEVVAAMRPQRPKD